MAIDQRLFDEGVDRRNTGCFKWDGSTQEFGRNDLIPLGVADMDFAAPPTVLEAMMERIRHGVFGYTMGDPANEAAVVGWEARRHALAIEPEDVSFSPGVIDSMRIALAAVTEPGDTVVVMTPVYGAFYHTSEFNQLNIARCPLLHENGVWSMDYEAIERALRDGAKTLLLCNPHNPVGRVWTREELETLVALTKRYGAQIIADEIRIDLEMPGYRNTPILGVDPDAISLISATKTFNLAALRHSSVVIKNKALRDKFRERFSRAGVGGNGLFGVLAQRVAYETGDEWLDALLQYLGGTRDMVERFLKEELPEIPCSRLQATYLMWLDFRSLGMNQKELRRFTAEKAGLDMVDGTAFGPEGEGFMRMNIATPRGNVERALNQLKAALRQ